MGELAASLAHEILHPIATARNNARAGTRFLEMTPPNLPEVTEALACIVRDADRAKGIVDRMRDHIKKAPSRSEPFDLNGAVDEVIEMVQSAIIKNKVSVRASLNGLLPVRGDRVQLQQVVLNLILNAVEAMSAVEMGSRELSISTSQIQTSEISASVQDSGPAVDPEHLDRVFAPFYTNTPRKAVELEWVSRFADPLSSPMGVGCGQRPIDLGAQYFSSLYRQTSKIHELFAGGSRDSSAERRQRSRWWSSTGLAR
jgi:C4-dicarboxylate-specific signal transduction histidine kinase